MPALNLNLNEKKQWTEGAPNILSDMLINGFVFLRSISTYSKTLKAKGSDGREIENTKYFIKKPLGTEDIDVTEAYQKVLNNITHFVAPTGRLTLLSPTEKDKSGLPLDYSALLGAYFRKSVMGDDGDPIVRLNDDELNAVYKFVTPLAGKLTPQAYLDSIGLICSLPKDRHLAVLKDLIFKDVSLTERTEMFKDKYKSTSDDFVEAMLTTVEFMRTPFRVLDAEEQATVARAKKPGGNNPKTSGLELQWGSMIKGVGMSMQALINAKGKPAEFETEKTYIKDILNRVQGVYGVTNANYKAKLETDMLLRSEVAKLLAAVVGKEPTTEVLTRYIAWYRDSILENSVGISEVERAKINNMSLMELVLKYEEQQQKKQIALLGGDTPEYFATYIAYYREQVIKAEGASITPAVKDEINKMSVTELLEKNIKQQAVALKSGQDYRGELETANAALTKDLATSKAASTKQLEIFKADKAALTKELETSKAAKADLTQKLANATALNDTLKTEVATTKADVVRLTGQLSAQKTESEAQIAAKVAEMATQKLALEKRNKVATDALPELNKRISDQAEELVSTKAEIERLKQQLKQPLLAPPAKEQSAEPVAAVVVKQEKVLTADQFPLLKALCALQAQAGEPSEESYDKKLYNYCEKKIEDLSNGEIKDPGTMLANIKILTNIMTATKRIEDTLSNSTSGKNKATKIHNAMNDIEVEKRHELLQIKNLKPGQEFSTAQAFVDGLLMQRSMIFKTAEARSFSMFKTEMANISAPLEKPSETPKSSN